MGFLPVVLPLQNRRCLVVGGGRIALQKVEALESAGASIELVAPEVLPELAARPGVRVRLEPFREEHLEGAALVIAATDDPEVNHRVHEAAVRRGMLVNVVDDPPHCNFIFPSVLRRGDLTIAVSTGGASPALARLLREELEGGFAPEFDQIAAESGRLRREAREGEPDAGRRRALSESVAALARAFRAAPPADWRERLQAMAADARKRCESSDPSDLSDSSDPSDRRRLGSLTLVGAGPGDPELLTLAGARALAEADVVIYDRLVHPALLAHAPRARHVLMGKEPGERHACAQARINESIVWEASQGRRVVRLKGGDPLIFGRGGEELALAREHGIACRVIPGVTAALGAAAASGIPLTRRDVASSVAFVTGCGAGHGTGGAQLDADADAVDWAALAHAVDTIVIYMGAARIQRIARVLVEAGRPADQAAAVIRNATLADQEVQCFTLGELSRDDLGRSSALQSPSVVVIGDVVALSLILRDAIAAHHPAVIVPR
jgi:uroporphyrin-III C-methyltransferase/precorrin-2 dehydrogenase/sirohydrochlorin ferrochelatase